MTKMIRCKYCNKKAIYWLGKNAEPICNKNSCKAKALEENIKLIKINKEEVKIYGEE